MTDCLNAVARGRRPGGVTHALDLTTMSHYPGIYQRCLKTIVWSTSSLSVNIMLQREQPMRLPGS